MKSLSVRILPLLCILAACHSPHWHLQTGDLIFLIPTGDSQGSMDEAISAATGEITHVAIVDVDESGGVSVIDATPRRGVSRYSLDTFISDNPLTEFVVKRLRDTSGVSRFVGNARGFIGEAYDMAFMPDNGAMYCSELVREAYRTEDGSYLFDAPPMNFKDKDGHMPAFWEQSFERLGVSVPQGIPGTNPQDMSLSPLLETVETGLPGRPTLR